MVTPRCFVIALWWWPLRFVLCKDIFVELYALVYDIICPGLLRVHVLLGLRALRHPPGLFDDEIVGIVLQLDTCGG